MSAKIKTISIKAFRGIPNLELNLDVRSMVIHGENGTGKSSIVEALEFFFTGNVSSLDGIRGISLEKHGTHVDYRPDDVCIEVEFSPGNIVLQRAFKSEPTPQDTLVEYFDIAKDGTFILRRSQILEFIMCQPADRFRAIGNIIGIELLDRVEMEMMRVCDDLRGKIESKNNEIYYKHIEINTLVEDFSKKIKIEKPTDKDILIVINEILEESSFPRLISFDDVDSYSEEIYKKVKREPGDERIKKLDNIKSNIKGLNFDVNTFNDIDKINRDLRNLFQRKAKMELSVEKLLKNGRDIITSEGLDVCPLCEQEIIREKLIDRIEKRIKTIQGLSGEASRVRIFLSAIKECFDEKVRISREIEEEVKSFSEFDKEKSKISNIVDSLANLIKNIEKAEEFEEEINILKIKELQKEMEEIKDRVTSNCEKIINNLELTNEEKAIFKMLRLIEQARNKRQDINAINKVIKKYDKCYNISKKIYTTFSNIKKLEIQKNIT